MVHHGEIELKFEIDAVAAARLRRHPLLAASSPQEWSQRTVYFDTGEGALRTRGYTLRVRRVGRRFTQTVKTGGPCAGLFDREEWESTVPGMNPERSALAGTPLARFGNLDRLEPIAEFDIDRTRWTVEANGSAFEVVLDRGRLSAGGHTAPIHELELELKEGDARALFEAARALSEAVPMEVGVLGKAERATMLAQGTIDGAHTASRLALRRTMNVGEAVRMIMHECIRHFRLNRQAIIADRDPEAVHQARVAIRRLRSVFSFFRPAIRQASLDPLRRSLRDFALPFGRARNLDVFLARHGKSLAAADRRKLGRARDEAYDRLIDAMAEQQSRDLILGLVEWSAGSSWAKACAGDSVADFAGERFEAVWRKLRGKASRLPDLEERQLHRLRIGIKKLRYALELMASLYPANHVRRFTKGLEAIQDDLGLLHDDLIAAQLIEEFSLKFTARAETADRSRCVRKAEAHFRRMKRLERVWAG